MKYKVGDKTLLGEIVTASMGSFPYLVDGRWRFTESEIDKIIIKPKRNIDHLAELREMDSGAAYKFWKDNSRMNPVCYEDVAFMLAPHTEQSKYTKLTPEEIKALKLARDCGFNFISKRVKQSTHIIIQKDDWIYAENIPAFEILDKSTWITEEPMSINELLDAQERREPE